MPSLLARFWKLRRSPNANDQLIWWLVVLCIPLLVLVLALLQVQVFLIAWFGLALLLVIVPAVWAFYHHHVLWEALAPARNWAVGISVLNTLVFYSLAQQRQLWTNLELFSLGAFLIVFGLCFLILFLFHMIGACIGIMTGTGMSDLGKSARHGAHAWGFSTLLLGFLPGFDSPEKIQGFYLFLKCSIPIATLVLCLLARTRELDPHTITTRSVKWLEHRLILRSQEMRSVRFFDFRGAALGLAAGVLALCMSATEVFNPMQLQAIGPLVRLRNSNDLLKLMHNPAATQNSSNRVVLVELDPSTRNRMLGGVSESRMQAMAINRLAELGARAVVLPMPLLEPGWLPQRGSQLDRTDYRAPQPDATSISGSREDLDSLLTSVRNCGRVILATHGLGSENSPLATAARSTGDALLDHYKIGTIKTIPTDYIGRPPLPYLVAAELDRSQKAWQLHPSEDRVVVDFGARDPVIVNYLSNAGEQAFPRITYSTLLQSNMSSMYIIPPLPTVGDYPKNRSDWQVDRSYFLNKIVFLDSVAWHEQLSPIGTLSMPELQAHAALTLASYNYIQRAPLPLEMAITVLFGLIAGHLCLRRDPLRASWRVFLAGFVLVGIILCAFVFHLIWIDPVLPLIAATLAFVLVTQFTFSFEHVELQRNRALLQRFVAPQVVEELLKNPEETLGLGGRRQNVCVLFVDMRNFTPFAERHTSEEVIETINAYMTALTEVLHRHGGLLDKYTGDGLMALFRVVQDPPNEEIQRAVHAALAMRSVCRTVSQKLKDQGRQSLEVGVSVHYGEAVVGLVGNPNQFNYTALGHTVVVSSRLNSVTPPGEVLVSDSVYQAIADQFAVEEWDEVMVKGLSQPVRPYRVLRANQPLVRTRLGMVFRRN